MITGNNEYIILSGLYVMFQNIDLITVKTVISIMITFNIAVLMDIIGINYVLNMFSRDVVHFHQMHIISHQIHTMQT